ncbi:MAG: hypothetical protein AAF558_08435 [Verrucomicrobiota bacterium]
MKGVMTQGDNNIVNLLQYYNGRRATGTLQLSDWFTNETGYITFVDGEIINCQFANEWDRLALLEVARRSEVSYELTDELWDKRCSIRQNLTKLLMNLAFDLDESSKIDSGVIALRGRVAVDLKDPVNEESEEAFFVKEFGYLTHYGEKFSRLAGGDTFRGVGFRESGQTQYYKRGEPTQFEVLRSESSFNKLRSL